MTQSEWLRVRRHLEAHRFDLGVQAADGYPHLARFFGTPLLTTPSWVPDVPIPLGDIALRYDGSPFARRTSREYGAELPGGGDNYADVYQALAAPRTFENRSTYRLTDAELTTARAVLGFGAGRYFDGLDTGEASAHAYAAARLGLPAGTVRSVFADPCDLTARPANLAVSALTLCRRAGAVDPEFYLHWRDPAKVGHAGGLYQVVPSGVFQASGEEPWHTLNDFSLVRFLVRECSEELNGAPETYRDDGHGIDYAAWDFARRFQDGLATGRIGAWCVGLGVDPLTFATDLLAVLVFEEDVFESLFGSVVESNDEGRVLAAMPFDSATVTRFVSGEKVQAAGAGLLAGALHHREFLLGQER
jgi:hypothetical protein